MCRQTLVWYSLPREGGVCHPVWALSVPGKLQLAYYCHSLQAIPESFRSTIVTWSPLLGCLGAPFLGNQTYRVISRCKFLRIIAFLVYWILSGFSLHFLSNFLIGYQLHLTPFSFVTAWEKGSGNSLPPKVPLFTSIVGSCVTLVGNWTVQRTKALQIILPLENSRFSILLSLFYLRKSC